MSADKPTRIFEFRAQRTGYVRVYATSMAEAKRKARAREFHVASTHPWTALVSSGKELGS